MIFVTGDTHTEVVRFSYRNWEIGRTLTKEDFVIVCGDFGLVWSNPPDETESYWTKWLENKPWTTLFVDGNHENHWMLRDLPRENRFGGEVGVVSPSIFHLRRGEIYTLQDKKFLAFGGAHSIDRQSRTYGMSWWPEEECNCAEERHCIENLEKIDYKVDYVLTHTAPVSIIKKMFLTRYGGRGEDMMYPSDTTSQFLSFLLGELVFTKWFCGHLHENIAIDNFHFLYWDIVRIL